MHLIKALTKLFVTNMGNNVERNDSVATNALVDVQSIGKPNVSNPLPENSPKIRGWLFLFLIVIGVGAICNILTTMALLNISDYSGSIWFALWDVFIASSLLCVAIYTITAIMQRKPNAIFWGYVYLIGAILTNVIITLTGAVTVQNEGKVISSILWGIIWILYLSFSKQVKRRIPKSYRQVSRTDKLVVILLILVPILLFVIGVVSSLSTYNLLVE